MKITKMTRWRVFAGVWIQSLFTSATAFFSLFALPLTSQFGWSSADFSMAYTIYMFVYCAMGFVGGLLAEKLQRYAEKGQVGRPLKLMVVGIPNVGKSTFINQIAGRKGAKAENRPGVTRGKQWVNVDGGLLLLDTPGILWPKFDDPEVGMRLAYTGAVKDDILDTETLGCHLMELLAREYPGALTERYKIEIPAEIDGWELLQAAGRKRGFLVSGGEVDTERMAKVLLDEYRSCKLGTFTLERPEELA